MSNIKAMVIGNHTYGYFNEETTEFTCTHGDWYASCRLISDKRCIIFKEEVNYQFIGEIPSEYNRT